MSAGLECDIEQMFDKFCDMTIQEMNKAVRSALRSGGRELVKQTKANARAGITTRNNPAWYNGKRISYTDQVEDAPRMSKIDGDFDSELSQKVHVMGTRKTGSQTYKFRFLEKGTKKREAKTYKGKTLKDGRDLDKIDAQRWFQAAQGVVFPQLEGIYIREINKAINKLNNTNI